MDGSLKTTGFPGSEFQRGELNLITRPIDLTTLSTEDLPLPQLLNRKMVALAGKWVHVSFREREFSNVVQNDGKKPAKYKARATRTSYRPTDRPLEEVFSKPDRIDLFFSERGNRRLGSWIKPRLRLKRLLFLFSTSPPSMKSAQGDIRHGVWPPHLSGSHHTT